MKIFCMRYDCIHLKQSNSILMFRHDLRYKGTCTRQSIEIGSDNACKYYEWDYKKFPQPIIITPREVTKMANKEQGKKKEVKKPKGKKPKGK